MNLIRESIRWINHHVFKQRYVIVGKKINYGDFNTHNKSNSQENWKADPLSFFIRRIRFDTSGKAYVYRFENTKHDRIDILNDGKTNSTSISFSNNKTFWSPYLPFHREKKKDFPKYVNILFKTPLGKKEIAVRRVYQSFGHVFVLGSHPDEKDECILLYEGGNASQVGTGYGYRRNEIPRVLGWEPIKNNTTFFRKKVYPTYNVEE